MIFKTPSEHTRRGFTPVGLLRQCGACDVRDTPPGFFCW